MPYYPLFVFFPTPPSFAKIIDTIKPVFENSMTEMSLLRTGYIQGESLSTWQDLQKSMIQLDPDTITSVFVSSQNDNFEIHRPRQTQICIDVWDVDPETDEVTLEMIQQKESIVEALLRKLIDGGAR